MGGGHWLDWVGAGGLVLGLVPEDTHPTVTPAARGSPALHYCNRVSLPSSDNTHFLAG